MFYSCSLATATLATYAILSGYSRTASTVSRVYAAISFDSWSLLDLSSLDCTVCARTHSCRLKLIRVAPNTSALMTVAVASLRHFPSTRLVMTCMCVLYSDTKYDIDVVSHYSTNFTIGFKGKSVFWFPKIVANCRECVGFGVCFVIQSTTIASVLT